MSSSHLPEALSLDAKRALLARLIQERLAPASVSFDLSEGQKAIWLLSRTSRNPSVWNTCFAARVEGALDLGSLNEAIAVLVRRHPSLRCVFFDDERGNGQPQQRVLAECAVQVQTVDLPTLAAAALAARVSQAYQQPFDLERGPLVRVELFRGRGEQILLLTVHHLVYDGWSLWLLVDELIDAYRALSAGSQPAFAPVTATVADYVRWQREFCQSAEGQAQLDHWLARLTGDEPPLQLPTDLPRPKVPSHRGGSVLVDLGPDTAAQLARSGREHQVTLYVLMLAAYFALLRRYGDEDSITVGTLFAGSRRQLPEFESVVGYLVNPLPIHCEVGQDLSFAQLLQIVKDQVLDVLEHQDHPFSRIVERLKPKRDTSRHPIFQTLFAVQRPQVARDLAGFLVGVDDGAGIDAGTCTLHPVAVPVGESRFDLTVDVIATGGRVLVHLMYADDLFRRESVEQIGGHFATLLGAALKAPHEPLWRLPLLSAPERAELLGLRIATDMALPDTCFAELFEAAAARHPDKVALRFGAQSLNYRELDQRANQVADALAARGAHEGSLIGLAASRSLDMVLGLLAVAKLRAAYVPIDPGFPIDRVQWMLEDAAVALMLTQSHLAARWQDAGCTCLLLDQPATFAAAPPRAPAARADGAAYVIYTSGSTGRPKGVQVSHGNVTNFLFAMRSLLGFGANDSMYAVTTLSFDIAVLELYLPLICGGTVIVADAATAADGQALRADLSRCQPTWMQATPASWQLLLAAGWTGSAQMSILCGGEALPSTLAAQMLPCCRALWNVYGPTETTVWSLAHQVGPQDVGEQSVVPIGRPIANTPLLVLDRHRQLVPDGTPGELYIGGLGVSQGYRGRADLTAERFVHLPEFAIAGAFYRTGDLVRWRRDGVMEFLGRADQQLKLRGFRIEPGEIESVMLEDAGVREAVVVCREDQPGDRRLVAYVAPRPVSEPDGAAAADGASGDGTAGAVENWRSIWDSTYGAAAGAAAAAGDPATNLAGWRNSYDHAPVPAAEMQAWLSETVAKVLDRRPRHLMEIGCGTGMLLFRIAPHCERYHACDLSAQAIRYVGEQLSGVDLGGCEVSLNVGSALEVPPAIAPASLDCVLLNSVVQYFPDADYLRAVLARWRPHLRPGGCFFIGDVRNHALDDVFHGSVALFQKGPQATVAEWRDELALRTDRDSELTLTPAFFAGLASSLPGVSAVVCLAKQAESDNEMTKFRYDVVIVVDEHADLLQPARWQTWSPSEGEAAVARLLAQDPGAVIGVAGVPDARLAANRQQVLALLNAPTADRVGAVVERAVALAQGTTPQRLMALASAHGCVACCGGRGSDLAGHFDVVFYRPSMRRSERSALPLFAALQDDAAGGELSNLPDFGKRRDLLVGRIRSTLKARLPEYMCPSAIEVLRQLPKTPNGKINRAALPAPLARRLERAASVQPTGEHERRVAAIWCQVLGVATVGLDDNFFDLGGHSFLVARARALIEREFGDAARDISLFELPTVRALVERLLGGPQRAAVPPAMPVDAGVAAPSAAAATGQAARQDIAIVGLACRVPGANDAEAFWQLLAEGREGIRFFTPSELDAAEVPEALRRLPGFVPAAALLEGADLFDAEFFGYSAREAAIADPQHRVMLECAWHALEDAGCADSAQARPVGVFVGAAMNHYVTWNVVAHVDVTQPVGAYQVMIGNDKDYLATRVSYKLNLVGPSMTVQTACSTSLVAVHQACNSLRQGECDLALAGGVAVQVPQRPGYVHQEGMILSPDGHCRAFDAAGRGTVGGSGVGVVVLKRLDDALRDGDTIRAVIRGTAINNDGAGKIGYTAPSVAGQADVIERALARAGLRAGEVSYVEAHGTATELGDPIEIAGLGRAFAKDGVAIGRCAIGSVKSNIGHLDAAAGVVGLIKTVLSLEHRQIPASLHYSRANPKAGLETSPFFVNTSLRAWDAAGPRRAGVSSFGIGGTNAHVVLEEAPAAPQPQPQPFWPPRLLCLSAQTPEALRSLAAAYARRAEPMDAATLAALCFTAQTGNRHWGHRLAVPAVDGAACARLLRHFADTGSADRQGLLCSGTAGEFTPSVEWVFESTLDAQALALASALQGQPVFRAALESCRHALEQAGSALPTGAQLQAAAAPHAAALSRAQQYVVQVALARQWQAWGATTASVQGIGWGEFAAACVAGLFPMDEGVRLVADREQRKGWVQGLKASLAPPSVELRLGGAGQGGAPRPDDLAYWRHFDPDLALRPAVAAGQRAAVRLGPGGCPETLPALPLPPDWPAGLVRAWAQLQVVGVALDWQAIHGTAPRRRVPLPAYPFQRRRHWLEPARATAALPAGAVPPPPDSAAVSTHPAAPAPAGGAAARARVSVRASRPAWSDHVVQGRPIAPGTLMLRWMFEAACRTLGTEAVSVRDLVWQRPLVIGDAAVASACVTVDDRAAGGLEVEIQADAADAAAVTLASASVAGALPAAAPGGMATLDALRRRLSPSAAAVAPLYERCRRMGIDYGPALRIVRSLGSAGAEALGLVHVVPAEAVARDAAERWALVLDGCLQLIGACLPESALGSPVMPAALDAFTAHAEVPDAVWSHVTLVPERPDDGHAWAAQVTVFDPSGACVAEFRGLHLKARPAALPSSAPAPSSPWQDWLYRLQWQPHGAPTPATTTAQALAAAGRAELAQRSGPSFDDYRQALASLNRLAAGHAALALHTLGLHPASRQRGIDALAPAQRRLLPTLERMAHAAGPVPAPAELARLHDDLARRWPFARHELTLLGRCGEQLSEVLAGRVNPLEVLFPDADTSITARFYAESVPTAAINAAIAAIVKQASAAGPVRLLEIGAGSGSTCAAILGRSGAEAVDYCFTDVSAVFLQQAQRRHAARGGFAAQRLDIGHDPLAQGLAEGSFDIIVAANVLHATPDIVTTLRHARTLLRPGGVILIAEAAPGQDWVELVFGITDGWWLFEDTDLRRDSPLVGIAQWTRALRDSGLVFEEAVPSDAVTLGQSLLIARRPIVAAEAALPEPAALPQRWIVLGEGQGLGHALVGRLAAAGCQAVLVAPGGASGPAAPSPDDGAAPLAARLPSALRQLGGADCIANLLALDVDNHGGTAAALEARLAEAISGTLASVRALADAELGTPPRVLLVTRSAVAVADGEPLEGLWQSPFTGMARVLRREHPEFSSRAVDLSARGEASEADLLMRESRLVDAEESVAYRNGQRQVPRLRRCDAAAPAPAIGLRADRAYLIAGGTGALGLTVARRMVQDGARTLVLASRRGRTAPADEAALAEMAAQGAQVRVVATDLSSEMAVRQLLAEVCATGLPLGGVVHAAGVLDDGVLLQQSWPRFQAVLAPKLMGAWHLHRLTEGEPLDFFVLYSSIASVFGFLAQASHTAASAFLDALAWHRAGRGQPALVLNWGPWRDIGAAAARSGRRGNRVDWVGTMERQPVLEALAWAQQSGQTQVGVFPIDWQHAEAPHHRLAAFVPAAAAPLGLQGRDAEPETGARAEAHVAAATPQLVAPAKAAVEAPASALPAVREVVASILGIAAAAVEADRGLFESGLDSLAAIELRQRLQARFGVSLPATLVFKFPTVAAIAEHLQGRAEPVPTVAAPVAPPAPVAAPPAPVTKGVADGVADRPAPPGPQRLEELSEDELAQMLRRELGALALEGVR